MTKKQGRYLGLVGGLGPPATIHYYRELVGAHMARGYAARLLVAHADIDTATTFVSAKDYAGLARYLASFIDNMAAGGAELSAMVAITPHICMPQLVPISPLPIIDMVAEVASALRAQAIKRIVLFGTRYTIETQMFGRLKDFDVVMPKPNEIEEIHNGYIEIVSGRSSPAIIAGLSKLARTFVQRERVEKVLLAGTDLSTVFNESNTEFPSLDCARIHIEAIMRRLLS